MAINTKIFEHVNSNNNGKRYVDYTFTTEYGDKIEFKHVLEGPEVDLAARAAQLEASVLEHLKERERGEAMNLCLEEGINPADMVFKYNVKNAVLNDMYSKNASPLEAEAAASLSKAQNFKNKLKLFLGL